MITRVRTWLVKIACSFHEFDVTEMQIEANDDTSNFGIESRRYRLSHVQAPITGGRVGLKENKASLEQGLPVSRLFSIRSRVNLRLVIPNE